MIPGANAASNSPDPCLCFMLFTNRSIAFDEANLMQNILANSTVWYKTKFGCQNFGYQIWCLFCYIYNVFKNMFNMSLMIMWWNIMVQWFPMSFEKFGGLPTVVAFGENEFPRQGQINFPKYEPRWVQLSATHQWMKNCSGHNVLKAITNLQSDGAISNRRDTNHSNCV